MAHQLVELRVAHERAVQHQNLGLAAVLVQHVLEVPEPRLQAHHAEFAQAVNRRVRDLREVLPEEMAQRAVLARQHGRRRIITHGSQRFLAVLGHGGKNLLQLLNCITGSHLTAAQLSSAEQRFLGHAQQCIVQLIDLANPLAKGTRRRQLVLDLGVTEQLALGHIHGQQLPRPQRALAHHTRLVQRHHARLGARNQHAVRCHHIAHRAQATAVQTRTNPAAIGHRQGCRTVPRLHHGVAVGIHIAPCLRQLDRLLGPRLGHQHRLGHRRGTTRTHQHLEH